MKILTLGQLTLIAFLMGFSIGTPVMAQILIRVNTPGTDFSAERPGDLSAMDDVPGGRRFRGKAGALLRLRAVLRMPPSSSASPKMQQLVVHFRTSRYGPKLRTVELLNRGNGLRLETMLAGDYTRSEILAPRISANMWDFKSEPITLSSQPVLRLEVQFPIGIDSQINPGEFFLSAVGVDFPGKARSTEWIRPKAPSFGVASRGVIYAVAKNNDLLWYRHDGHTDGSVKWIQSTKVGNGWNFKQVFSGGGGVIYAITSNGDLFWYRHNGYSDGSVRWTQPTKVGNGWNFKQVFSGGGGVIYAITASGDLLWYRHDGYTDGSVRWTQPTKVGNGWNFRQVFFGGGGVIYAITSSGDLLWSRHDGYRDGTVRWTQPTKIGSGWDFTDVFD